MKIFLLNRNISKDELLTPFRFGERAFWSL